jgi:exosortase D (VPLPA-CTERM-specific)
VGTNPLEPTSLSNVYRFSTAPLIFLAVSVGLVYALFGIAIGFMVGQWGMDEFSHGYLIPFVSLFLIWQRRDLLRQIEFKGAWTGPVVVLAGIALDAVGRLSALFVLQHIALLVVIAGLVLALTGWEAFKVLSMPLGVLVFMIPLPNILLNTLSSQLQLISSSLGVKLLQLAGVSVFLQGNVIDLGAYKLEVAEACSGLRYLLPLMTLSFLMACLYRAPLWKRATVFLSSIPLTLLVNSLRIAAIGIMVDRWGIGMAEGLLHEVQGWMMFMLSTGILMAEVVGLNRLSGDKRGWRELFSVDVPPPVPAALQPKSRKLQAPLVAATAVIALGGSLLLLMPERTGGGSVPARESLATFPLEVGPWSGKRQAMEQIYLNGLKLDDYLMADYVRGGRVANSNLIPDLVNMYVAWYNTQSAGEATHSPRACLPGGGWRIADFRQVSLPGVQVSNQPLRVNRALIEYGNQRQIVYYWFEQRGRVVTKEYMVKWYLLVDSITRHRSDGALIRLIKPIPDGTSLEQADAELSSFAGTVVPQLDRFIPG